MTKQKLTDKQSVFVKASERWFQYWVLKYDTTTNGYEEFFEL